VPVLRGLREREPRIAGRWPALLCAVVVGVGLAGCGGDDAGSTGESAAAAAGDKQKVAWLFYGPKDDGGYNTSNWDPAEKLIDETFGDSVEQTSTDNIPYSTQLTQIAGQAAQGGATMLIDTAAGADLFTRVCEKNPKVACLESTPGGEHPNPTEKLPENVSAIFPEFWDMEYLMGVAAGLTTKSHTIGFIKPYDYPLGQSSQNAFLLGCQSVDPQCKMRVVVTDAYYDPPVESRAATTLINAGADVIHGLVDTPTYCQVAEERGVRAIGQWRDYSDSCPKAWLTSPVWDASKAYVDEVQKLVDGEWTGRRTVWLKLGEGANVAPMNENAGEDTIAAFKKAYDELKGGANPFVGPLTDTKGKVRVPEGETISDKVLYNQWDWSLKGTVG
jgi:basic membrane lipoprotein Med (substrate-binding protein (PBP1-ABC) superfamily)